MWSDLQKIRIKPRIRFQAKNCERSEQTAGGLALATEGSVSASVSNKAIDFIVRNNRTELKWGIGD